MILGDNFGYVAPEISRALLERVRDEAQVLASRFRAASELPWADHTQLVGGEADDRAIGFVSGAALALGLSPLQLLSACGALWGDK